MRKIKLIWDFRGPDALKIAEHHDIHLKQFVASQNLAVAITGFEIINEHHAIAYLVVEEAEMKSVRDILKPHRGTVYLDS
ncbi:hypothetical protein N7U66_19560 [Lacinutrix neustonica]|uniref:Uncharacterized protein n=1 Tax=Lacinutrix neustonica TaxID=2980107 RepID=A0A9E8SD31_9FLAO|nr:hypothetical protein [Lacinutrix neustonica]WAC01998.1 hypothetical protein N7U66_19560 [Lacinutrix neustonica]